MHCTFADLGSNKVSSSSSSIFPKLVSAVTIVMASSDATRNAMKCEFFRNKIILPSILLFLDAYEFDDNLGTRIR